MQFFARLALISTVALASAASAFAAEKGFSHQGVAADAKRYETFLKTSWKPTAKSPADLKAEAEKVFATDPRAASRVWRMLSRRRQDAAPGRGWQKRC